MRRSVPPLVSCEWLANELKRSGRKRLKIIDSTWFLPNSPFKNVTELTARELFWKKRIPGAVFLDIDRIGDPSFTQVKVPHNLPRDASFLREILNLRSEDHAIVYDQLGIFSSPRGMFTLEAFGHVNVSVLDGGLPMWLKLGLPVEIGDDEKMTIGGPPSSTKRKESVTPSLKKKRKTKRTDLQWSLKDVQDNIVTKKYQLVDMRPSPRYNGKMKESRPNTRSGHVPGSFNVRGVRAWCSSAKRENFNNISHFERHFVVRSARKTTHSISCSFLTLNITTLNINTRIRILNSRFALEHRYLSRAYSGTLRTGAFRLLSRVRMR